MGKVDENKKQKREALLNTAYELFTTKGTNATAISDIVRQAGVAKGTFYLYFKDKYDIKNKLVAHKTSDLFQKAGRSMREAQVNGLENQLIYIIDHIINTLVKDLPLMNFISKNLVMGALRNTLLTGESDNSEIYDEFIRIYQKSSLKNICKNKSTFPILVLFMSLLRDVALAIHSLFFISHVILLPLFNICQ